MGILNKFLFWRKDESDFDFDNLANKEINSHELGLPEINSQSDQLTSPTLSDSSNSHSINSPASLREPISGPNVFQEQQKTMGFNQNCRELELISSKLDTIKVLLTSLDQRTANLEKVAGVEKKEQHLW